MCVLCEDFYCKTNGFPGLDCKILTKTPESINPNNYLFTIPSNCYHGKCKNVFIFDKTYSVPLRENVPPVLP